jgi:hypothetical protein
LWNSQVRIHDGTRLAQRTNCEPDLPYHPKTYLLRGTHYTAVIAGSGNLSRNGLQAGHEVGVFTLVDDAPGAVEEGLRHVHGEIAGWFNQMWANASPLTAQLLRRYSQQYDARTTNPVPTDDDVTTPNQVQGRHRLDAEDLMHLRTATHLWIQAGRLHQNRGRGNAGNQLMMSPMSRVFFGFPAADLPTDTTIGRVIIQYNAQPVDRSLRFSNNSMDVLGLPIPEQDGPPEYDEIPLLFTRRVGAAGLYFDLQLAAGRDESTWRRASQKAGSHFTMTSGRQWGVF